jgi:DNA processing protein
MIELRRGDAGYPQRLARSTYGPERLWVSGHLPPDSRPTIAIVGTRRMTDYGRRMTRELASTLARAGAVIVSGLAQGIDSTAHIGAVAVDGCTVAVLGEGLLAFERMGPIARRRVAHAILERGAVISEYPVDAHGDLWTFPKRNATIAGLADAVVVVEAPTRSGALITASYATSMGRTVYAIPGPLGAPTWHGSNSWIADGRACPLTAADQLAVPYGLTIVPIAPHVRTPAGDRLLDALAIGPADADTIAARLSTSAGEVATVIAELLIGGSIVATGDGRFARR